MLAPVPCEEITAWLDANLETLPRETIPAAEGTGRVAAVPLAAPDNHPPAPVAATDGFAVSARATVGASEYNPLPFRVGGPVDGETREDEARAVVCGDVLPDATDAVVPLAEAEQRGGILEIYGPVAAGDHVVDTGREALRGDELFASGRVLRPVDVCLAEELGLATLDVVARPRVRLVPLREDASDTGMIASLVKQDGGTPEAGRPGDNIFADGEADLYISVGGTGFGPNDHAVESLESAGELLFRGVAINPGETASLGRVSGVPVVLLPGSPLDAWFAYELLAGRAIRILAGRRPDLPYGTRRVVLDRKIVSGLGRLECCRLRIRDDRAEPIAVADNRTLSTAVRADGFVLVPAHSEGFAQGTEVPVYLFDQRH